jgi:HAD superfamily hydrolase (TIGR01509 family)
MATKAVLWDLGNVLLDWSPAYLYREHFSDEAELRHFLDEVCTMTWHAEHDRGVPMAENRKHLIAQYPHYEEQIRAWETGVDRMVSGTIPGTAEAMEALHGRGVAQYALTNLPAEWTDYVMTGFAPMRHMRDVVVSAHEGVIKPDRRIYEITAERIDFEPSEVVFFDDRASNVEAARAFGFDAEVFEGGKKLHADLKKRGLLGETDI